MRYNVFHISVLVQLLIVLAGCSAGTAAVPSSPPPVDSVTPAADIQLTRTTAQPHPTLTSPMSTPLPPTSTPPPPTSTPLPPTPAPPTPTPLPDGPLAPELAGGGPWLNSEPLTLEELRGQVVLVNFWTYGCYNCQNTLPHVKAWWETYADEGLVIIGVHTPELSWEYPLENVQAVVAEEGITWPVVQDNDKIIWHAYKNRFWPRFYLVDHRGRIIYNHIGEGAYEISEQHIVAALEAAQLSRNQ